MPSRRSKFRLGDRVPEFVLPDGENSRFSLREHLGRGPLLLGFIRGTWCPFCRRFMRQVLQSGEEMQSLGCEVVLIASQPLAPILQFSRQEKLPFKILADADRAVTRRYGIYQIVGLMGVNVARPAAFLLDEQGRILFQYVGSAIDRPPISEVLTRLKTYAKQKGALPAVRDSVKV
ncbi:MAG: peroxiredoxin family protein [Acidobacteriia bacterium]|nr:peroxiredoxin family protein [Terriglobia bacterium]